MGFYSNFLAKSFNMQWPNWFREKYKDTINFPDERLESISAPSISGKSEYKLYGVWKYLFSDIQKVLIENKIQHGFTLVILHECAGIAYVTIFMDKIISYLPQKWEQIEMFDDQGIMIYDGHFDEHANSLVCCHPHNKLLNSNE